MHWRERANCRGIPVKLFFPERGGFSQEAKACCTGCVVKAECYEYAMTSPTQKFGVWGGTSERERRRLRKELKLESVEDYEDVA